MIEWGTKGELMSLLKSKTILSGLAVAILGLLEGFDITNFAALIPDQFEPLVVSAVGLLMIGLRLLTTKPVSEK